ncbi:MAG TPA: hypothetical protein VHK88_00605 [Aquihabitans sp.]|nr:hypothetical protein [Aquihabitans sp.]
MEWILVGVLAALMAGITLVCIAALMARTRFHRYHRVDTAVPTDAPLSWLVDPRTPARLHRRLAKLGTTALAVASDHTPTGRKARKAEPTPIVRAAQDLCARAVALDRQVTRLATLAPAARRAPLLALDRAVADLEAAGAQLVALSAEVQAPARLPIDDPAHQEITQRVDRLAQAHRELLALDDHAGLVAEPLPAPPLAAPGTSSAGGQVARSAPFPPPPPPPGRRAGGPGTRR